MTTENNARKGPPRRRRRTSRGGRGGGMPPIMWLAVLACVVGAVVLFRSGGGDAPVTIGENQTVVTAPETAPDSGGVAGAPRSGDVDIAEQARDLTPERPAGGTTSAQTQQPAATPPAGEASTAPAQTPTQTPTKAPAQSPKRTESTPPPPPVSPAATGPYLVQVGSFSSYENAEKETTRLATRGWKAEIKMSDTSEGTVVYRVRIGYFASRAEAETFIRQNRRHISGAIPVHR